MTVYGTNGASNPLTDALADLHRSTTALHARFGTRQTPEQAIDIAVSEFIEVLDAQSQQEGPARVAEEVVDVFVTMFGVLSACGVSHQMFIEAIGEVAKKNDDKTTDTHTVNTKTGKIARIEHD